MPFSERANRTYRVPSPSPQEPTTMFLEYIFGCPKHNLTCSADSHSLCDRVPPCVQLCAYWAQLTNTLFKFHNSYISVLWYNLPNVVWNIFVDSFHVIWNKQTLNQTIRWSSCRFCKPSVRKISNIAIGPIFNIWHISIACFGLSHIIA